MEIGTNYVFNIQGLDCPVFRCLTTGGTRDCDDSARTLQLREYLRPPQIFFELAARSIQLLGYAEGLQAEPKNNALSRELSEGLETKLKGDVEIVDIPEKHETATGTAE